SIGSTSVRSSSALITRAPRSAGCTVLNPPPRRPTGVRTASMMYASDTGPPLDSHHGAWPHVARLDSRRGPSTAGRPPASRRDAVEQDGQVLLGHRLRGQRTARPVPAHGDPHRVADEPEHQLDVQVGAEGAGAYALLQ